MISADTANSILIGLVSGVLTATLLWFLNRFWNDTVIPKYESHVYKGLNIQGTWELVDGPDDDGSWAQHEVMSLKQIAHRLSGTATLVPKPDLNSETISLDVSGDISDRFVSLTFRSPIKNRLSYSVLLLEIVGDGNILRGSTAMYDVGKEVISSHEVEYVRKK